MNRVSRLVKAASERCYTETRGALVKPAQREERARITQWHRRMKSLLLDGALEHTLLCEKIESMRALHVSSLFVVLVARCLDGVTPENAFARGYYCSPTSKS